jgi:hypothetical protein
MVSLPLHFQEIDFSAFHLFCGFMLLVWLSVCCNLDLNISVSVDWKGRSRVQVLWSLPSRNPHTSRSLYITRPLYPLIPAQSFSSLCEFAMPGSFSTLAKITSHVHFIPEVNAVGGLSAKPTRVFSSGYLC